MRGYIGEVMAELLTRAVEDGVLILEMIARPSKSASIKWRWERDRERRMARVEAQRREDAIRRLMSRRLVNVRTTGRSLEVRVTVAGRMSLKRYQLDRLEVARPKVWDGRWRVVGFDIPEKERIARDVLRALLRRLGFYPLQKSVWILPFPCRDEVEAIRFAYGLGNNLWYAESDVLDREVELREYFDLLNQWKEN